MTGDTMMTAKIRLVKFDELSICHILLILQTLSNGAVMMRRSIPAVEAGVTVSPGGGLEELGGCPGGER